MPATKKFEREKASDERSRNAGMLAREHVAVLVSTLGMRLNRGATAYYRAAWNIGIVEWRLLMTLKSIESLNVSELSDAADVDKAAASRSLAILADRGLISIERNFAPVAEPLSPSLPAKVEISPLEWPKPRVSARLGYSKISQSPTKNNCRNFYFSFLMPWIMLIGSTNGSDSSGRIK